MGGATMRIVGGLIGCMIAFVMFPMVLDGADDIKTDAQTDVLYSSTSGSTTDDVVLTEDLYEDSVNSVSSITSTNGSDTPTAQTYTSATDTLTVAGLAATGTRNLTIAYSADPLSGYTGLSSMVNFGPLIIFLGIIVASVSALWSGVNDFRKG